MLKKLSFLFWILSGWSAVLSAQTVQEVYGMVINNYKNIDRLEYSFVNTVSDTNDIIVHKDSFYIRMASPYYYAVLEDVRLFYNDQYYLFIDDTKKSLTVKDHQSVVPVSYETRMMDGLKEMEPFIDTVYSAGADNGLNKYSFSFYHPQISRMDWWMTSAGILKMVNIYYHPETGLKSSELRFPLWNLSVSDDFRSVQSALVRVNDQGVLVPGPWTMGYDIIEESAFEAE